MSLFKAREWWTTVAGEEEQYDMGCMCVANVDNSTSGLDKVVVGSFHGYLRIYNPRPVKTDTGWSGFQPEDVMCEVSLQQPVIQVEAGRFMSGSESLHLAVLHPRKLSVYSLVGSTGTVEHGTHYQLKLAYEHNLQRTAFGFCYGPFGAVKGRDFICVQSMDGTISIFEQESFAFSRFLPGALLPGPLKYVARTDSFVTVSSSRQVESYKYQVLAVATDAKTKEESQNLRSGKRVAYDWTFNTGEQALDLKVVSFPEATSSIYILGERNLFVLTEAGKLRFVKKFEYNPSCFLPYSSDSDGAIRCLVATHTNTMLVYQDVTMKWAAQLTHIPVQVGLANFNDLKGVVVCLDEEGHLQCLYMGTDPSMFATPMAEVREMDYPELDQEMRELNKIIKEQQSKSVAPLPTQTSEEDLQIITHIPPNLDEPSLAHDAEIEDEDPIPSITVKISMKTKTHLNDVRVNIHVAPPLGVNESLITFHTIEPSKPVETQVTFYMKHKVIPASLKAEITATYLSPSGAPRVAHAQMRLPFNLAVKPCAPIKTADFKVTVDTNKPPVNLNDIFPELLGESAGGLGNALGFSYYGQEQVITVLASKTSQRYRLQCDDFGSLWLVLSEVVARLTQHYRGGRSGSDFRITYDGPLPLQEYFDVLDAHFDCRQQDEKLKKHLEERAAQFRAIQRRLLTRFKDKTPAPLANLDTLLDGTYRQISALADVIEENRKSQERTGAALSCATRSLLLLIRLWQDMSASECAVLESAVSPLVYENGSQGWEETVDAAVTHLLRTCLAKSSKDQTVNPAPLGILKDTTKLKKHIALVCDRLSKGAKLTIEGQPAAAFSDKPPSKAAPLNSKPKKSKKQMNDHDSAAPVADLGTAEVPAGSRFGEKKSPRGAPTRSKDLLSLNGAPPGLVNRAGAGALPPLGGGVGLPALDMGGGLPVADAGQMFSKDAEEEEDEEKQMRPRGGIDFRKKKKKEDTSAVSQVPDLDEMETSEDGPLLNGTGELVYGM